MEAYVERGRRRKREESRCDVHEGKKGRRTQERELKTKEIESAEEANGWRRKRSESGKDRIKLHAGREEEEE